MVELKDVIKGGIKEKFAELRRMGIKTVMITGLRARRGALAFPLHQGDLAARSSRMARCSARA
ncbi:MAG TPA: hypothetical protein VMF89_25870 [Polyangiales bacterium]|nr:hypothetical protein [Polyangiales bacterium]